MNKSLDTLATSGGKDDFTKRSIGIQVQACILPRASIKTTEGYYHLKSKLQSSFSAGMNYKIRSNSSWTFGSGALLNLVKRNFFIHIPDSDLNSFPSTEGAPQIEDKSVYLRLIFPFYVEYNFHFTKNSFMNLKTGVTISYSGFSKDEIITTSIADSNFQLSNIFYGIFKSSNDKKPWVDFLVSTSKNIYLKNNNLLSVELFLDFSTTKFIKGSYQITIPSKPISKGTYSVTGSCIGLSLSYTFTGSNRKFVKEFEQRQNH